MKFYRVIFFTFLLFAFQEKSSVNVYRMDKPDRLEIYASNDNFYPVTIEVDFKLKNLSSSKYLPYITDLAPGVDKNILELKIEKANDNWNYESTYKFYMGSIYAEHDENHAYSLPFEKGDEHWLSQGFGGKHSHEGDLRHSLDFAMFEGTKIYAARGGVVADFEEKFDRGGTLEQYMNYANFITILHRDGTFADYSHLKQNGALVEIGDEIKKGQLIGYSGATGYASGPHLHFVVKKAKRGGGYLSIPVKFATKDGIAFLEEGKSYTGY